MVGGRLFAPFREDESGIALSEALITCPIVLLVFAAFVEFGYAMSQWNQTVKALQYGARLAAVSDPLVDADDNLATPNLSAGPVSPAPGGFRRCLSGQRYQSAEQRDGYAKRCHALRELRLRLRPMRCRCIEPHRIWKQRPPRHE